MTQAAALPVRALLDAARAAMPAAASGWPLAMAMLSPQGQIVAQEQPSPLYAGVLEGVASAMLAGRARPAFQAGQLHLSNDPYAGGLGLDVVVMLAPVPGGAGFAGAALRVADIGAMRPDIFAFGRQILHQGVRLEALEIVLEEGRFPDTLRMFLEANTRAAAVTVPALEAVAGVLARARAAAMPASIADPGLPAAQGHGAAAHDCGARIELDLRSDGNLVTVAVEPAPMDPDGLNAPLQATRAGILTALGEAASAPSWAIARRARIDVPPGSRFNATYPSAVNLAAEGAWLAYRATMDALGRRPTLAERDFAAG